MAKATDDLEAVRAVAAALEGFGPDDQERIIRWAREKLGLAPRALPEARPPLPSSPASSHPSADAADLARPSAPSRDLKSFVAAKSPKSDIQFAAVVAYYFRFEAPPEQRRGEIDGAILQDACRLAGRERFKSPRATLNNAKNQGLLDSGGEAGRFAVNTVGENLVAMALPSQPDGVAKGRKVKHVRKPGRKTAKKQ